MRNFFFVVAILCVTTFSYSQTTAYQTIINKVWEEQTAYPDTVEWSNSVLLPSNSLVVVGNTYDTIEGPNIYIARYSSGGNLLWERTYDGAKSKADYGVDVATDASGNIYVIGAGMESDTTSYDIVVLKYNSFGSLQWDESFDGAGSMDDIPTDITLDLSGNIYICGSSEDTSEYSDYVTLTYSNSGTFQWASYYNYNGHHDIPASIAINDAGTAKAVVTGGSAKDTVDWDYTTVVYNLSGTQLNVHRDTTGNAGIDKPHAMTKDAESNYYITGSAFNGTSYEVKTIKLDSTLNPVWIATYDRNNDDGGYDIALDTSGNVIVTGYSEDTTYGTKSALLISYNNSGVKLWDRLNYEDPNIIASGTKLHVKENQRIFMVGYSGAPGSSDIFLKKYNSSGELNTTKEYNNLSNGIDYPNNIIVDDDNIYVSGKSMINNELRFVTIKYEQYERL